MRKQFFCLALVLVGACGSPSSDKSTGSKSWENPDDGFRIGRGYDADAIEQIRGDCIVSPEDYLDASWQDAQGVKARLTETRITSHEDLLKELNFSMSASGRYTFYNGSLNYAKYEKFNGSEDNFTWLFNISAEVGSKTLKTEQIGIEQFKPEVRQLIQQARAGSKEARDAFRRMCGTKFVRSVRLGGNIVEVLEISAKASGLIRKIHSDIKASGGGTLWKASMSTSFDSLLRQATRSSMLKREFHQNGGEKIHYDMSPEKVEATLDSFGQALRRENAVVIAVELIDWDTILDFAPTDVVNSARGIKLEQLVKQLWRHREKLDKIDTLIYLYEKGEIDLEKDEVAALRKGYEEVSQFIDRVMEVGQACYLDEAHCGIDLTPVAIDFPAVETREIDGKVVATDHWTATFPADAAEFQVVRSGKLATWSGLTKLRGTSQDGHPVELQVEMIEESCKSISELLSENGATVLAATRGEPLRYTEDVRKNPAGKYSVITFGYKDGSDCLSLHVFSDPSSNAVISMSDDSDITIVVRRLAQSVRKKD